jgi:peptidyl-prolyl cis-trans isomerase C
MDKRTVIIGAVFLALAVGFPFGWGCRKEARLDESKVVARVGDAVLTVEDLERLDKQQRKSGLSRYLTMSELMDNWVQSEVIYQAALKEEVDRQADVAWELYNTRKAIVMGAYWNEKIVDKFLEASDADALAYYDRVKDEQYRAKYEGVWFRRMLFNTEVKAKETSERLEAGEDFVELAMEVSVSPDKVDGGSWGYRRLSDINPTVRAEAARLKVGDVSPAFKYGSTWVIIKVEDRVAPGGYLKPDGIGMRILKDKALAEKREAERIRLVAELTKTAKIQRFPQRIPLTGATMVPEGPSALKTAPATGNRPSPAGKK